MLKRTESNTRTGSTSRWIRVERKVEKKVSRRGSRDIIRFSITKQMVPVSAPSVLISSMERVYSSTSLIGTCPLFEGVSDRGLVILLVIRSIREYEWILDIITEGVLDTS